MSIFYVNNPSFAVALERLQDPGLRRYPVVVAAGLSPRAPILCVSSEAHALGARKGAKLSEVKRLDRALRILPADHRLYQRAQERLEKAVQRFTPCYQADRLGSFFLDMEGSELLFGKPLDASVKIQREVERVLSLRANIGAANNKLVSRIAAKVVRPNGLCDVLPGNEAAFLTPLPINFLPASHDLPHPELLRELGLSRIGELEDIPTPVLIRVFGRKGERLKLQARGMDPGSVEMPGAERAVHQEVILNPETNNDQILLFKVWRAIEELAQTLRKSGMVSSELRLHGIYTDQRQIRDHWSLVPPTNLDFSLFRSVQARWPKFLKRRVALKSLDIALAQLVPQARQLAFAEDGRELRLLSALDGLRRRYGDHVVQVAKG